MFLSADAKLLSIKLRKGSRTIKIELDDAFERAIVNCGLETDFIDNLVKEIQVAVASLKTSGLPLYIRVAKTHQKPIVRFDNSRCELADLLVVTKYRLPNGVVEKKSVLYQVKMAKQAGSGMCDIDQTQLRLLRDWPPFQFGRQSKGGVRTYTVEPRGLEFGSYMLEPRNPNKGQYVYPNKNMYGTVPTALTVNSEGPHSVDLGRLPYTRGDSQGILSQILFEIGEHHVDQEVSDLIDALYRHLNLSPDPHGEFEGFYSDDPKKRFVIIELIVAEE